MALFCRRPLFAFVLGAAVAATAVAGRAAYAALADDRVAACYVPQSGALYVTGRAGTPASCLQGHVPIDWSVAGPPGAQGPPGAFSGTFRSANGAYALSITDDGVLLQGPGSSVRLTGATVTVTGGTVAVQAETAVTAAAGRRLSLTSAGAATLRGSGDVAVLGGRGALVRGTRSATLDSRGTVTVRGARARIQASGTVVIKGSRILQN